MLEIHPSYVKMGVIQFHKNVFPKDAEEIITGGKYDDLLEDDEWELCMSIFMQPWEEYKEWY